VHAVYGDRNFHEREGSGKLKRIKKMI